MTDMIYVVAFPLVSYVCLGLAKEDGACSGVVRRVRLQSQLIRDLSVAYVLQVGHGVVIAHFGAGLELLQSLRRLSRRELGARLGRDAA